MPQPNIFWPSSNISANISGTIPVQGSVAITFGTVAISTGTLATITSVSNVAAGSIAVTAGTVTVSGTVVAGGGTISNVAGGTIAVSTGTIASITNVAAGSIAVTAGTVTVTGTVVNAGGTVANIAGGTIAVSTGTIASVTNVVGGTIAVSTGTIATLNGTVATQDVRPSAGALTAVTGSTAAHVTVLAANANRKGATVYNNTAINFFMSLGTTAGTGDASYTVKLTPGSYYEFPFPTFTGSVTAIASATGGTISVTEFT